MKIKNKTDFIKFIKAQLNIELENDDYILNKKRKVLYTKISRKNKIQVLSLLQKYKIYYEEHTCDYYFVYL